MAACRRYCFIVRNMKQPRRHLDSWVYSQSDTVQADWVARPERYFFIWDPPANLCATFIETYHYIVHIWL